MNQLAIDFAKARRDEGIQRAGDHAGDAWQRRARGYLLEYLATFRESFLTEDVRAFADERGLDKPPDGRAWGVVMQSAKREGLIRANGWGAAKSSNLSGKVKWVPN